MNIANGLLLEIEKVLSQHFDQVVNCQSISPVGGGCINKTYKVSTTVGAFFVKMNVGNNVQEMFESEMCGLSLLRDNSSLSVPNPFGVVQFGQQTGLLLEYVQSENQDPRFWSHFGQGLAKMHQTTNIQFGLDYNNFIGSLRQDNTASDDWIEFFRERRIEPQLKLAVDSGSLDVSTLSNFERWFNELHSIFPKEPPALLHGDLWSGNFLVDEQGKAALIDPAVYYGHREVDLAFSQMFGGFDHQFYEAYDEQSPLQPGFVNRVEHYNMYPLLVHVNLFGGGYIGLLQRFISVF